MQCLLIRLRGRQALFSWDSSTNTIPARVMDAKADQGMGGMAEQASRVTNTVAANDTLKEWAVKLRKHLDTVHGKTVTP